MAETKIHSSTMVTTLISSNFSGDTELLKDSTGNLTSVCPPHKEELSIKVIKILFYSLVMLVSLVGNSLFIAVISRSRRMRTVTNYLLINNAVSDLLITVFNMPTYMKILVTGRYDWIEGTLGLVLCKSVLFIQGLAVTNSVLTLTAIATDRFLAVTLPHTKRQITVHTVKYVVLSMWIVSFISVSPLLYALALVQYNGVYICDEKWSPLFDKISAPKDYTVALFFLLYLIPLALISVFYSTVIYKTWFRITPGSRRATGHAPKQLWKKRLIKMLVTVIVLFAFCWLPMHVRSFLYFFKRDDYSCGLPPYLEFIGYFMGHANAALNPCVYFLFNLKYWKELRDMPCTCCRLTAVTTSSSYTRRNPQRLTEKSNAEL